MSWLIESYLEETPKDDYLDMQQRATYRAIGKSGIKDGDSVATRAIKGYKAGYNYGKDAEDSKTINDAIAHKYGSSKLGAKDTAKAMLGNRESKDKAYNMAADRLNAKDALDRHNRRHPESKLECADIIEILQ